MAIREAKKQQHDIYIT